MSHPTKADRRAHRAGVRALAKTAAPCPFCGARPYMGPTDPWDTGNAYGFVACLNDRCAAQPQAKDGSKLSDDRGSLKYISLAVRRWNRRRP